jgi:hypothetical protein
MAAVEDLTRDYWAGRHTFERYYNAPDFHWTVYDDAIPILATTLPELSQHGPHGRIWRRFGHEPDREDLTAALANPDGEQAHQQHQEAVRRRQQAEEELRRQEQEEARRRLEKAKEAAAAVRKAAAAREAARQACQSCGRQRHDDEWDGDDWDIHPPRTPPPDGVHCADCRTELAQPCTRLGRFVRRVIDSD